MTTKGPEFQAWSNKVSRFLDLRQGASDSDVSALMDAFEINETEAAAIYRAWLDNL